MSLVVLCQAQSIYVYMYIYTEWNMILMGYGLRSSLSPPLKYICVFLSCPAAYVAGAEITNHVTRRVLHRRRTETLV